MNLPQHLTTNVNSNILIISPKKVVYLYFITDETSPYVYSRHTTSILAVTKEPLSPSKFPQLLMKNLKPPSFLNTKEQT